MAGHAVSDQGVRAIKEMIIEIKVARFFSWRRWKLLILIAEFWKMISQQVELHGGVHVNAHQFTPLSPQRIRQALSVGDWLIKVYRCHMEAMAFPERKYLLKFPAVQATRDNRRNEFREFHCVDGLPRQLVCKLAKNRPFGIKVAYDPH